ncbi:MAG: hypothetical protein ACD_78C00316G0003 [uncultured bacterium (gcode 4)]|uniref:Phosphoglycerate mutase n=1 Tax=uncultured bacterium (gcode 4) TaxID=1234023 RepID=K1XWW2_9BACT|nr:MAG: hypothetical protein ACD_78C00316G0003 [uncultured bacterium (gcode 4)]
MKVSFIRHGDALYNNIGHEKDFLCLYGDLKPDAIEKLRLQARAFAEKIDSDELVTIWSSPIPRAIETANIFTDELDKKEISIRKRKLFAIFEEARGFRWEYLRGMVSGGETKIHNHTVILDKNMTNPKGLSFGRYFRESAWKEIPVDYLNSLWEKGEVLSGIETFSSLTKRIFREIERLAKIKTKGKQHVLIFTHQCNTDFLTELLNEYQHWGILTGENITLEHRNMDFDIVDFPQEISNKENVKGVISGTKKKFSDILQ